MSVDIGEKLPPPSFTHADRADNCERFLRAPEGHLRNSLIGREL